MKAVFFFLLSCLSVSVLSAQSGVLKTIGGAAKNKVEQQDFNSTRGSKEKSQYQGNRKRSAAAPGAAPESAAPEPADTTMAPDSLSSTGFVAPMYYIFGQQLTYVLDDPGQNSKRSDTVTYYYRDGAIMSLLPGRESSILIDFGNERLIQFDEIGKTAIVMHKGWAADPAQKDDNVTITKTGQTKKILGFTCEEYIVQGSTKSVCWVTTELQVDYTETSKAISGYLPRGFHAEGQLLEMTGYNSKGVANSHMVLTDFKEETVVKELSGYAVTSVD